jgi:DNA polymerase mu
MYLLDTCVILVRSAQKEKAIVTPQWLIDSVKHGRALPYSDYAALNDLHDETAHNRPDTDGGESIPSSPHPVPSSSRHPISAPISSPVLPKNSKLSHKARFCCARASPLVCPNQELAEQFDIVRRSRALESEDISALTYARAVAVCETFTSIFMSNCIMMPTHYAGG